ncbi:hypothetical protein HMI54_013333, partial [Coelomomyces lativittatus]
MLYVDIFPAHFSKLFVFVEAPESMTQLIFSTTLVLKSTTLTFKPSTLPPHSFVDLYWVSILNSFAEIPVPFLHDFLNCFFSPPTPFNDSNIPFESHNQ